MIWHGVRQIAGIRKLPAHQHRQQSAEEEEAESGQEKLDGDGFVIGRQR